MEKADFRAYINIHRDRDVCARIVIKCRKFEKKIIITVGCPSVCGVPDSFTVIEIFWAADPL